jgi:hypothetical protein
LAGSVDLVEQVDLVEVELVELVELAELVGLVGLVPEWGRMLVLGTACMLEGDRSSKQAALETSHQVDERTLETSVYMKSGRGRKCQRSALTRNSVTVTTTSVAISSSLFPCFPGDAGGSTSLPLAPSNPQLKGRGPWPGPRSPHD